VQRVSGKAAAMVPGIVENDEELDVS